MKARYRASALPQDCICGETERVQMHHVTYERVGEEALPDLTPLCPTCHAMIHALESRGEIGLDFSGLVNEQRAKRHAEERTAIPAGESWREIHVERLAAVKVRHIKSELNEYGKRAAKKGIDPRPFYQHLTKFIQWTSHELGHLDPNG